MYARLAAFLTTVMVTMCLAAPAFAEQYRTVVLKLRDGGTDLLVEQIDSIPDVEVRDQRWFLLQVRESGLKASKILTRPKDLRFVMSGSNIKFLMYVANDDGPYEGKIFDSSGELAKTVVLGDEFGEAEAKQMREAFETLLGISSDTDAPTPVGTPEVVSGDDEMLPVGTVEEVGNEDVEDEQPEPEKKKKQKKPRAPSDAEVPAGLSLKLGGRMFKRDNTYAGANTAVLSFTSAFYPGGGIEVGYVTGVTVLGGALGGWVSADVGSDSIASTDATASILHLDGGAALTLSYAGLQIGAGGRHIRYTVSNTDVFPSIAQSVVMLKAVAQRRFNRISIEADVELYPWGLYNGSAAKLFGGKSGQLGFAAGATLGFGLSDSFDVLVGYRFRSHRSNFPGQGTLDFNDSVGFELVHGPQIGIGWHP